MIEKQHPSKGKLPNDVVFFQFFMDSQKNLHAYILASVHNYTDANDILQETATVMWRKFDEFDQNTNFMAWGVAIARNLIKKYFNERKRSRLQFDDDVALAIEQTTMHHLVESNSDSLEALKKCCEKLSAFNLEILKFRYRDGMTIKAIASRLGKSIPGMYKFMARLQDSLLQCVKKTIAMDEKSI